MDGSGRTCSHTFAAEFALREINICNISFHGDGIVRTVLRTDSASDAGSLASFPGYRALVLVHAGDIDTHSARSLVAQLDDTLRAGLHACSAGNALAFVHDRKSGLLSH